MQGTLHSGKLVCNWWADSQDTGDGKPGYMTDAERLRLRGRHPDLQNPSHYFFKTQAATLMTRFAGFSRSANIRQVSDPSSITPTSRLEGRLIGNVGATGQAMDAQQSCLLCPTCAAVNDGRPVDLGAPQQPRQCPNRAGALRDAMIWPCMVMVVHDSADSI